MAVSKVKLPLKNVAKQIRNVASAAAPRDTGNLRNVLRSYNTPDRMVKYGKNGSANITFFFSPPGATYGKYWNSPYGSGSGRTATIKKRYPQHFDYADKAYSDPTVKRLIQDYAAALGKQVALDLKEAIRAK
jgi:hypothetical protein